MAEERVNEHTPPVFSFTDEETLSANRENTRGASSSLGTYPTISDDAWRYHWNTQPRPITDRTYSVDGVSEYGSTSYVHQPFSTSIDYATPSTSLTDMEQASAIVEGGARIFQSTRVDQWNTQYLTADVRSTDCGHVHIAESGITSSLPMVSSSSINHAQPSTSRACMEKASAIPENLASISDDAWLYQWNTQQRRITDWTYNVDGVTDKGNTSYLHLGSSTSIDHAMSIISRTGMEQAPAITESGARIPETTRVDLWNTQYHLADSTSTDCGHTGHTEIGSTDFTLPVCSSSPVARTSYARLQEPSDIFGNYAWYDREHRR
ncbi:serine-rich adhesin for platelets-like isoform X12 [Dermacentor albipictus]|uniref:serine-rich adhesin for platelets-like isoform X12 n=1 Tax=Dermacentor albipictus TaxID=60249 RepID=UPI0038FD28D7